MFFSKHNTIYKQCTKVTNIHSSTYINYKTELNSKLNTIPSIAIVTVFFGFPFVIELDQNSYQIFFIIIVISGGILWYKYKNKSFFAKDPVFKEMALNSNFDKYSSVYQNASSQLNKNKEAVRKTFNEIRP